MIRRFFQKMISNWGEENAQASHEEAPWNKQVWFRLDKDADGSRTLFLPTVSTHPQAIRMETAVEQHPDCSVTLEYQGNFTESIDFIVDVVKANIPDVTVVRIGEYEIEFWADGRKLGSVYQSGMTSSESPAD